MKATLHPYQQEALSAFLAARKGTLKIHPGGGKSIIGCAAIEALTVRYHAAKAGLATVSIPAGTGTGGPGYEFVNEDSDLKFDKAGVIAMANAGRDTNGSQFFITFAPADFLNGGYTIFGQVVSGMDVVNGITLRDPDQMPDFTGDVIESITIEEK